MHIPENYLSPSTCAVFYAAMLPTWRMAWKHVKAEVTPERLPLLGIAAAFSFLSMMFNVPLPGGTTGHAVGGTLVAILLGPWAATLAVSVALLVQALFFGDGGLLSFGANSFNMAFVLPWVGFLSYRLLKKYLHGKRSELLAAGLGAYVGINAAAFCAAVEFGVQPLLFTDANGAALYAPYPLAISIPAMMLGHLTLFGLAEAFFTAFALAYLKTASPALFQTERTAPKFAPLFALLAALAVLSPLGLLAEGTAWGEWGTDEIAQQDFFGHALGYVPNGMAHGLSFEALFPDYTAFDLPETLGYIVSAVIGAALLVIIFKLLATVWQRPNHSA